MENQQTSGNHLGHFYDDDDDDDVDDDEEGHWVSFDGWIDGWKEWYYPDWNRLLLLLWMGRRPQRRVFVN
jgi:hypothetical protein